MGFLSVQSQRSMQVTETVCRAASLHAGEKQRAPAQRRRVPGPGLPPGLGCGSGTCPDCAPAALASRFPWHSLTWRLRAPLPGHLFWQNLSHWTVVLLLFLNAHAIRGKSSIRSKATECHRLIALAVFSKKMALKRDCTFSLSRKYWVQGCKQLSLSLSFFSLYDVFASASGI